MAAELERDARGVPKGYLSVTTVLNPFTNLSKIDPVVLANAADRGQRVHKFCEFHAKNMLIVEPDNDCKAYVKSYTTWFDSMVVKPLYIEERVDSAKYKLSGGIDLVAYLQGDNLPTVVDLKTPATASKTWQLQTAAYMMLLEEELGIKIGRRIALMLPKDGRRATVLEYTHHEQDKALYLNALEVYRFFNG